MVGVDHPPGHRNDVTFPLLTHSIADGRGDDFRTLRISDYDWGIALRTFRNKNVQFLFS